MDAKYYNVDLRCPKRGHLSDGSQWTRNVSEAEFRH